MKAKRFTKRALSVLLVTVMLFSCWVFTEPTQASAATAGGYTLVLNYTIDNAPGSSSYLKVNVSYTTNNGKGTATSTGDKSIATNSSPVSVSVPGWPTKVSWKAKGQAWDIYKGHFTSATINGTSAWSGNSGWDSGGGFTAYEKSGSFDLSATAPAATYCRSLSVTNNDITCPLGSNTSTSTISVGAVTDQYGVNWYQDPYVYQTSSVSGFTLNGHSNDSTITVGSGALATASNWTRTYTIGVRANDSSGTVLKVLNGDSNLTASIKTTNPSYTVTYKWHTNGDTSADGNSSTTQPNIYYNQTPTAPTRDSNNNTIPTAYYTTTKHYTGGSFSPQKVTSTTSTRTNKMTYSSSADHTYVISPIANNDSNHLATCKDGTYYCGYTENQPHEYGSPVDNANGTHTKTCGTSGCGYELTEAHSWGAWQIIPEAEQDTTHAGHDRMAKHFRVCACGAKDYDNHDWQLSSTTPPTCTAAGFKTYECSDCHQIAVNLNEGDSVPATGHSYAYDKNGTKTDTQHQETCSVCGDTRMVSHPGYGAWYKVDDSTHAHRCTVCDKEVSAAHTAWSGWQHSVPAAEETGVRATVRSTLTADSYNATQQCFNYCTDCGSVEYQNHKWNDGVVTTEPLCESAGEKTFTCSDCENTKTAVVEALGHDMQLIKTDPTDNRPGSTYFRCVRDGCGIYSAPKYNEETKEIEPDLEVTDTNPAAIESNESSRVPSPHFANYTDSTISDGSGNPYKYSERKAGLKITGSPTDTSQAMRFAGSVAIPAGVSYDVDPDASPAEVDNVVLDFGFIYTQLYYHNVELDEDDGVVMFDSNPETFKLNGNQVYKMSVVENNADNGPFSDDKWTGVSYHSDENTFTFNLVIDVSRANYKQTYLARPYIIYKYQGQTYTVYDLGIQQRDVFFVAYKTTLAFAGIERYQMVTDLIDAKILAYDSSILPELKWITTINTYYSWEDVDPSFFAANRLEYIRSGEEYGGDPMYDFIYNGRNYGDIDEVPGPMDMWE